MVGRNIISRIGIWARIKEIVAYAIRSELAGKTTDELLSLIEQKRLLTLKKTLAEEEFVRRGIDVKSTCKAGTEQSENITLSHQLEGSTYQPSASVPNQSAFANNWSHITNYVKRHWRGEFELLESFWGNVVTINVLTSVPITLLSTADFFTQFAEQFTKTAWFLLLVVVLALFLLGLWQLVGLWRSASNHIRMTNRRFWARICKLFIILSTIGAINQSTCYASTFLDNTKFAFGLSPFDKYQVTLVEGGTILKVSGGIGYRLTEKVANELTHYPDVRVIHLNSVGGRLSEAHRLRDLISQRGLTNKDMSRG